jgi:hypothetical protein
MKLMHKLLPVVALGFAVSACDDTLAVQNLVSPDVDRVFATPASIEATIASGFQACHNGHSVNADLNAQLLVLALESYSQLNNFFMGPRGGIPRSPVTNVRGTNGDHFAAYSRFSRAGRLAVNAVNALDKLTAPPTSGTLGTTAQNIRARSFAFFNVACNQGFLALMYDSAGVVTPGMASDVVPPLSDHSLVMANALALLDSAEAIALTTTNGAAGGFPLPDTWLSLTGSTHATRDGFIRIIHSFRARFRAGVARTPTERAAVNWNAVLADATTGIQSDFLPNTGGSTGWNVGFIGNQMHVEPGWSQMSLMYFGMADQAGGCYDAQIALPRDQRNPDCLINTLDQRWPAGATRALQRTASPNPTNANSRPYIENRSVQDAPGDPWGWSQYSYFRYKYIRLTSGTQGPWPEFMVPEVNLLAAEAYLRRTNGQPSGATPADVQSAAALIDASRVGRGGLTPLTGVMLNATVQQVPGGASCVPRVPQAPAFNTNACGTLWEALKYEKRMETAYSGFGQWFVDSRGWGDLVDKSPLEYPVPFQELDALQKGYYGLGGGGTSSATLGTYGF